MLGKSFLPSLRRSCSSLTIQSLSSAKTLAIGREEIRPTTRAVVQYVDDSDSEYEYDFDGYSESDLSEISESDFVSNWE